MAEGKLTPLDNEPTIDNPDAPSILCDGYAGVSINAGVARFAFYAVRYNSSAKKNEKRHVLDLAMPIGVLMVTHQAMSELISDMQKNGMIQMAPKPRLDS
jgi:hypothetical protein